MVSPVSGLGCSPGLVLFLQHDRPYWARRRTAFLRNLGPSLYCPFGVAPVPGYAWYSQLDRRPRADPCLSRGHDDFSWAFVRSAPRLLPPAADLPREICRLAPIRNKLARGLRAPGPLAASLSRQSGAGFLPPHHLGNARDVRIRVNERFKFLRPERGVRAHRSCRGLAELLRWEEGDPGHAWNPGRPVLAPEESRADGRPDSRTIGYEQASLDLDLPYPSRRTTWPLEANPAPFGAVLQGQNLPPNEGFF